MSKKLIAVIIVAILASCTVGGVLFLFNQPIEGHMYDNCYLDTADAESFSLRERFVPDSNIGRNEEDKYAGDRLFKTTTGGVVEEVEMYRYNEIGDRISVEIDRPVRMIELADDLLIITFYGIQSHNDSYMLLQKGYKYDPCCQLTYIVKIDTGKMYNVTEFTRSLHSLGFGTSMYDFHSDLRYLVGDSYNTPETRERGEYLFFAYMFDINSSDHYKQPAILTIKLDDSVDCGFTYSYIPISEPIC